MSCDLLVCYTYWLNALRMLLAFPSATVATGGRTGVLLLNVLVLWIQSGRHTSPNCSQILCNTTQEATAFVVCRV